MSGLWALVCLFGLVVGTAADCWETSSCQLDSWQVKGCAQYGRIEKSRRPCPGGNYYTCCTGNGGGAATVSTGKTTRYWDCCKPSCSWPGKAPVNSPVQTCARDGVTRIGQNDRNGCEQGGNSYVCNNQQPFVINDVAYGFAAAVVSGKGEWDTCCACYELTFTSGPVKGKKMIVQVTNTGADLGANHFDIQIPGGGVGIFTNGCKTQWGAPEDGWGKRYGGVNSLAECNQLPTQIRDGCKWRFGWYKNANNPTVNLKSVTCPTELTSRSGCIRN